MNLATIGWPSGTDTGWPSEPRNMLPGRVEGFPAGVQASANTAKRLLSQAVGWWDADHYRDGDRLLRNRGVAGELLDLQLGSSDRVATSNDPKFLAPEDSGYVYLPGVGGNYLSVPDEAALDITGDIDIRVQVAMDDWTPSVTQYLTGKAGAAGNRSWHLAVLTTGAIEFRWSADGTNRTTTISTATTGITDGIDKWVRVTFDVDNGSLGNDVKFWLSDDGTMWSQLGSTVTTAGTTSIFSSSEPVMVGWSAIASTSQTLAAKVYRAEIWDGIEGSGGTKVLDIDCDAITDGSNTSFPAVTGQTVTINRSTSGRKSVAVPSRANRGGALFLFGTDDYMQVVNNWQHRLLNFDAGDSFTVLAVGRKWGNGYTSTAGIQIGKQGASSNAAGWRLTHGSSTEGLAVFTSDTVGDTAAVARSSAGSLDVLAGTWIGSSGVITTYRDALTNTKTATSGAVSTNSNMRVGRSDITWYADMEFIAAAVFRRALTAGEITTLTNYFAGRVA